MAKIVVLGVEGETGLWLVDFTAGTVTPAAANALAGSSSGLAATVDQIRASGYSVVKGVDLAVLADDQPIPVAHQSIT